MEPGEWDKAKAAAKSSAKVNLYQSNWLNNCSKELTEPGTPLEKVTTKVLSDLALKLDSSLTRASSENSRQAVYSLLGYPYVQDHFPKTDYTISNLKKLSDTDRKFAVANAKSSIDGSLNRLLEKLDYDKSLPRYSTETPLGSFLSSSKLVFERGIEKSLRDSKKMKIKVEARERSGRSIALNDGESATWDNRVDIAGQALLEICNHEPQRVPNLLQTFRESHCPLPSPLRYLIMTKFLFDKEKHNFVKGTSLLEIESIWQERFIKTVHQNTASLKVDRAIRSPIWQEIDNAVIEVYGRVATLRLYEADEHQIEAARVLNILHVYNRTFDPLLVLWLFPLQLTLDYAVKGTDDHVMKLAILFDLTVRHCLPMSHDIFSMADEVIGTWREWDKGLYNHVQTSAQKNVWLNPKDFPHQTIHQSPSEANKIVVKLKGRPRGDVPEDCLAVFIDPAIFVRKWIAEGFTGVLSRCALLYIWDQLFFNEWNRHTIRDICLALLFLLKNRFLKTKNYFGVREVFLVDPSRLFTADIRKAYAHVQNGDSFEEIPLMNRVANGLTV